MALLHAGNMHEGKNVFYSRGTASRLQREGVKIMPTNYAKGLRQRGKIWYLSFTPRKGDKQKHVCLNTDDYATAVIFAEEIRNRPEIIDAGTWKVDLDAYIALKWARKKITEATERTTREVVRQFFTFLKKKRVDAITRDDVFAFFDDLELRVKPTTFTTYHARLAGFFNFCQLTGRINNNYILAAEPHAIPPHQLARTEWLDKKEIRRLLLKCKDPQLKFILFMGFQCGLRKNEIVSSRPEWFDLTAGRLNIPHSENLTVIFNDGTQRDYNFTSKGKRKRTIPLTTHFLLFLKHRFQMGKHFCLEPQGKGYGKRYRYDFRRPLEDYFKKMGVKLSTHGMRHSFASNAIQHRTTLEVASYLGNRERTVEAHYAHIRSGKGVLDKAF